MACATLMWSRLFALALFSFALLPQFAAAQAVGNLVPNPSVETPNPTNSSLPQSWATDFWGTTQATFSYLTTGYTGSRSVKVQITKAGTGDAKWYFTHVPVSPGATYTFSDFYTATVPSQYVIEYTKTTGAFSYVDLGSVGTASSSWQQFTKSFKAPTGVTSATVLHLITAAGSLTVDDYSLTSASSTPPPAFSFSLSNGGAKTVVQGQSTTNTISAKLLTGTSAAVAFSASGLPSGATASFVQGSCTPTCTSTLTIKTASTAPVGTFPILVNASGGSAATTTSFSLTVSALPPPPPSKPVINSFVANPPSLTQGQSSQLSWSVTGASSTSISDIGLVTGTSTTVTPSQTTSYVLTAINPGGSSTATTTITVVVPQPPTITSFTANPTSITAGQSTTLSWSVSNASTTSIDNGVGVVTGASLVVSPMATTTYTITATNPAGLTSTTTTVAVTIPPPPPPPPPTNNLILNPSVEDQTGSLPTHWQQGQWGSNTAVFSYPVVGTGGAGTKALQVQITNYPTTNVNVGGDAKWFFDPISVSGGQFYTFTDKYISNITSHVVAEVHNTDGSFTYLDLGAPQPGNAWQTFSASFNIPSGASTVTVYHLINAVGTLTTDDYALALATNGNAFAKGMVSLTFDDGWDSIYTNGIPIVNAAGFKSTQYIITNEIGQSADGYMTLAEINTMKSQGHDIEAHTRNHPDLTTLSAAQLQSEVAGSRQDLIGLGFSPVDNLAYPYGSYNSTVIAAVQAAGLSGARTVDFGFNDKSTNPFQLWGASVERGGSCDGGAPVTTLSQVQSWIDSAAQSKTWVILVFHQIDNVNSNCYGISPSFLQSIITYLKTANVDVVTMTQGLQQMH